MAVNVVFPTIVLAVTGGSEEGSEGAGAPPKDESTLRRFLKNQSKKIVQALKRRADKAVVGSKKVRLG